MSMMDTFLRRLAIVVLVLLPAVGQGAIVYRTTGAWGTGKGTALTHAELDGNLWQFLPKADLLSTDAAKGASLIGTRGGGTVGSILTYVVAASATSNHGNAGTVGSLAWCLAAVHVAGGGLVLLEPDKTYPITTGLTVYDDTSILGWHSTIDASGLASGVALTISGSAADAAVEGPSRSIKGIKLIGNNVAGVTGVFIGGTAGILGPVVIDYKLEGMTINSFVTCVEIGDNCWTVTFDNCNLGNWTNPPNNNANSIGLKVLNSRYNSAERITLINSNLQGLGRGIYAEKGSIFAVNCSFDYNDIAVESDNIAYVGLSSCHIESNYEAGAWFVLNDTGLTGGLNGHSTIALSNCYLFNVTGAEDHAFFHLDDDNKKVLVNNCYWALEYGQVFDEDFVLIDSGSGQNVRFTNCAFGDAIDLPLLGAPNGVYNGDFELGALTGWTAEVSVTGAAVDFDTSSHGGTYAGHIDITAGPAQGQLVQNFAQIANGANVVVKFWAKGNADVDNVNKKLTVFIRSYDKNDVLVFNASQDLTLTTSYQQFSYQAWVPPGAFYWNVAFYGQADTDTAEFWIDDVKLSAW